MRSAVVVWILAVLVGVAGVAGVAAAQPAPGPGPAPAAGSAVRPGAGSGTTQRIELQPGKQILQPVRPGNQPPGPPTAQRQPAGGVRTGAAPAAPAKPPADWRPADHGDLKTGTGADNKLMALMFWLFALITIGGAVFVITRRNLIAAVMGMVGSFFGVAAVYMMLYASFLAVIQMLVYAGAIMVLFVFVIMILNKPEDEPFAGPVGLLGKAFGGLGMAYLVFRLVALLWSVVPLKTSAVAPAVVKAAVGKGTADYAWGTTRAVGNTLFNGYLFPFEAVSILLLVAVVGAIAVARPLKDDDGVPPPEGEP